MSGRQRWSRGAVVAGSIAMLVGAIDPMEGSVLILLGSALIAHGTYLRQAERGLVAYRTWTLVLIALGVGAMWALSAVGGIGGRSGKSMWWGLLIMPYLAGWLMAVWGPGQPRWFSLLGIVVGLWYLAIPVILLVRAASSGTEPAGASGAAIGLGVIGLLTIVGCARRLRIRARTSG